MTSYAFGFAVQGWWVGLVVGTAVLVPAIGNWRLRWHVPVLDTLRDLDPPYLAGG